MNRTNDTTNARANLLFRVSNRHAESCGVPPTVDGDERGKYHGYYENEHGEQFVFVYDHAQRTGTRYTGDANWEEPHKVQESGRLHDLLLSAEEQTWLETCWATATKGRGGS